MAGMGASFKPLLPESDELLLSGWLLSAFEFGHLRMNAGDTSMLPFVPDRSWTSARCRRCSDYGATDPVRCATSWKRRCSNEAYSIARPTIPAVRRRSASAPP